MYKFIEYDDTYKLEVQGILVPNDLFMRYTNRHFLIRILSFLNLYRNYFYLLIEPNRNEVLGCIVMRYRISRKSLLRNWWIYGTFIKDNLRGLGIGKILMQKSLDFVASNNAKSVLLYVGKENIPAVNLYKKYGFSIIEKSNHHRINENDYLMKKDFSK